MFRLDPVHPLFDAIVDIVAKEPGIPVSRLHERLAKNGQAVTLQHLYRTVRKLGDEQMLLKTKGGLRVNLLWLTYLEYFAEKTKRTLLEDAAERVVPLKQRQRVTFKVDTLHEVQTLWNHLLIQLYRASPQKYLFKYYSHAWWQLGKHTLDTGFYRKIKEKGVSCYWLYGNDTFLDREAAGKNKDLYASRIHPNAPFPKEGYNVNVYGEYVLECLFPEQIANHFALLFQARSRSEFDADLFSDVFALKGPYKVSLWRNERQAAPLRAKIGRPFLKHEL